MFGLTLVAMLIGSTYALTTVEILSADPRFSSLVSFVVKAGLVDTLNNGNFTIFAPTNDAFAKLPPATVAALSNVTLLTDVLLYHVKAGSVMSAAAKDELVIDMANGGMARFNIYTHNNVVTIQGSTISEFDKVASNGVIHVIDSVMMEPTGSIVDYVISNPDLSTLLSLVKQAGLAGALSSGHFTLFAPNNAAFARVPQDQLNQIASNPATLEAILKYHVVDSTEYSVGLYRQERLDTLNPTNHLTVHFIHHGQDVKIKYANVVSADNQATNGVVHVIDHVLIPGDVTIGRR